MFTNLKILLFTSILVVPGIALANDRMTELEQEVDDLKIRVAVLERLIDIKLPEKSEYEALIQLMMLIQEQQESTSSKSVSEREAEDIAAIDAAINVLENQIANEEADLDGKSVMSALAYIQDEVRKRWVRPPDARNGMAVELRVHLVPTGEVINIEVTYQKDASKAFVNSVIKAVKTVKRFDKLEGLDPVLFDANFRTFKIIFRPEDLRL